MSDKPEVHQVFVEVKPPKGDDPGQVCLGYYTLVDDLITMTDGKGIAAQDDSGKTYTAKLDGEYPSTVAGRLTRKLRDALLGKTKDGAPPSGFNAPLSYPKAGIY
jgi:hypothetical protein